MNYDKSLQVKLRLRFSKQICVQARGLSGLRLTQLSTYTHQAWSAADDTANRGQRGLRYKTRAGIQCTLWITASTHTHLVVWATTVYHHNQHIVYMGSQKPTCALFHFAYMRTITHASRGQPPWDGGRPTSLHVPENASLVTSMWLAHIHGPTAANNP